MSANVQYQQELVKRIERLRRVYTRATIEEGTDEQYIYGLKVALDFLDDFELLTAPTPTVEAPAQAKDDPFLAAALQVFREEYLNFPVEGNFRRHGLGTSEMRLLLRDAVSRLLQSRPVPERAEDQFQGCLGSSA